LDSYSAPLYVDIKKDVMVNNGEIDPETGEVEWVPEEGDDNPDDAEKGVSKVFIGKVLLLSMPQDSLLDR
jgi:hypothetical protein